MGEACAHVAVDRNLVKVYDGKKIYMKNGQEFGFWLVNNTREVQKAEIEINGKLISSQGLVLRPAQKVWLDCNWDTNRRFKFETYEIDDTNEAKSATADNGKVVVKFYAEKPIVKPIVIDQPVPYIVRPVPYPVYPHVYPWLNPYWSNPHIVYCSSNSGGGTCGSLSMGNTLTANSSGNASLNIKGANVNYTSEITQDSFHIGEPAPSIETGRIEAGSKSDQQFTHVDMEFNTYYSYCVEYQILPESRMPVSPGDVKLKCECGKKIKHKDVFCSRCGKKLK